MATSGIVMQEVGSQAAKTDAPSRQTKQCPLRSQKFVGPEVTPGTHDILFIGWNPGAEEVKQGRPFVGASGKLLRGWVRRLGLTSRAGYSNSCFYRPPGGNREPTKQEVEGCIPINIRLIEAMRPKLIVCLGAAPARMFGFKGSVGSMTGRFKIHGDSTLVTVLYHPAYAVRLKGTKRFAEVESQTLEVLQEAIYRIGGDRDVEDYPRIHVVPVFLGHNRLVAIDTEHHGGLRPDGTPDPRLVELETVQAYDGIGPVLIGPNLIAGPHHPLLFHNAVHDLIVLSRHGSPQEKVVGDSMVAAWMLGRQNLSLKGLAWRELGARVMDYDEAATVKPGETELDAQEKWDNYCAQDPVLTWRLHTKLYGELRHKGIDWLYDNVEMPLQPILAECSLTGLEVDHEKVMSLWGAMDRRLELLEERMRALVGPDFNPASPKQVLSVVNERGIKVKSTDSKVLSAYINDEFVRYLLAHRVAAKRISTYYKKLSALTHVSGIFKPIGTGTGRLSQVDTNIQNLPPDVKGCLKARDGCVFVYRDYSQIELRLAAFLSRDRYLLAALKDGRNVHEELCIAVYGYRIPELYTKAKSANFERLYGGSLETRANALGVSPRRLERVEPAWPDFEAWAAAQRESARHTGEARTLMGRMMKLHGIESSDPYIRDAAERQAINMPEQGGAADICKYAMVLAQPLMKQLGGRVAHQEHDSILCEVPQIFSKEADQALDQAMTEAIPQEIRDVIEIPSKSVISSHWG